MSQKRATSCTGCQACKASRSCCLWLQQPMMLFQHCSSCMLCWQRRICRSTCLACIGCRPLLFLQTKSHLHTCQARTLCTRLHLCMGQPCLPRMRSSLCCLRCCRTCLLDIFCTLRFPPRRILPVPLCPSMCPWDSAGIQWRNPMSRCRLGMAGRRCCSGWLQMFPLHRSCRCCCLPEASIR